MSINESIMEYDTASETQTLEKEAKLIYIFPRQI